MTNRDSQTVDIPVSLVRIASGAACRSIASASTSALLLGKSGRDRTDEVADAIGVVAQESRREAPRVPCPGVGRSQVGDLGQQVVLGGALDEDVPAADQPGDLAVDVEAELTEHRPDMRIEWLQRVDEVVGCVLGRLIGHESPVLSGAREVYSSGVHTTATVRWQVPADLTRQEWEEGQPWRATAPHTDRVRALAHRWMPTSIAICATNRIAELSTSSHPKVKPACSVPIPLATP